MSSSSTESGHGSPSLASKSSVDSCSSDFESERETQPDFPVLSHAERRRQKRKAKTEVLTGESSSGKRRKVDKTSTGLRRQNSVWVGNLSFKTDVDGLKAFFNGVGEITRVHMPTKAIAGGKVENRGFAYVDFATVEAKTAAIAKSEQPLLGRRLLIKNGDDFTGRPQALITGAGGDADGAASSRSIAKANPGTGHSKTAQKILRTQKQQPAPTLFLGNLGFETTEKSIRELFEAHRRKPGKPKGKAGDDSTAGLVEDDPWIRKVRLGTFEDSGLCKGFAFVDFTSTENATSALIDPKNHHLDSRNIVVEYASPDAVRRGGNLPQQPKKDKKSGPDGQRLQRHAAPARMREGEHDEKIANAKKSAVVRAKTEKVKKIKATKSDTRPAHDRSRPKPGAALAQAKRESAAIIPSKSQKIKF